jgi:hypothetical protein
VRVPVTLCSVQTNTTCTALKKALVVLKVTQKVRVASGHPSKDVLNKQFHLLVRGLVVEVPNTAGRGRFCRLQNLSLLAVKVKTLVCIS